MKREDKRKEKEEQRSNKPKENDTCKQGEQGSQEVSTVSASRLWVQLQRVNTHLIMKGMHFYIRVATYFNRHYPVCPGSETEL